MKELISSVLIILTSIAFYYRTWNYGLVSDDIPGAKQQEPKEKNRWHRLWIEFLGKRNVHIKECHIMTHVLHTLNCLLIYFIFGHNNTSLLASILFLINPINLYNSVWISGKPYTVGATFALLTWALPLLSPIFYTLGLHFSNNIIFFPLVLLKTKYWFMAGCIAIALWRLQHIFSPTHHKFSEESNKEMRKIHWRKFILYCKCYGYYLFSCLIPHKVALYHDFVYNYGVSKEDNANAYKMDAYFWGGFTVWLFSLLGAIYSHDNGVGVGLWWFLIMMSMWCNFICMQQQIALRYVYSANIGLMLALSSFIINYPILIAVFLTGYAVRLWYIIPSMYNEFWNVDYNIIEAKNLHYTWVSKGVHKFHEQQLTEAILCMTRAKDLRPNDFKTNYNLAVLYLMAGNINECKKAYEIAKTCSILGKEEMIKAFMGELETQLLDVEKQLKEKQSANIDARKVKLLL